MCTMKMEYGKKKYEMMVGEDSLEEETFHKNIKWTLGIIQPWKGSWVIPDKGISINKKSDKTACQILE